MESMLITMVGLPMTVVAGTAQYWFMSTVGVLIHLVGTISMLEILFTIMVSIIVIVTGVFLIMVSMRLDDYFGYHLHNCGGHARNYRDNAHYLSGHAHRYGG